MYSAMKYSIFFTFLVFSMVTNILGAITPLVIKNFSLTLAEGSLLTLSFFIAYGIASIPAGMFSDKYGKKTALLLGIAAMFFGLMLFLLSGEFVLLLVSTLIAGIGVTFIQVGANPLVEEISKPGEYVKNLNVTHAMFGVGSFLIPLIVSALLSYGYGWKPAYLLLSFLSMPLFFMVLKAKSPRPARKERFDFRMLPKKLMDKRLMSFALGLFFYVGTEVGIATWMILFLKGTDSAGIQTGMLSFSLFWLLLAVGRFVGGHITHRVSSRMTLTLFSVGAISCLAASLLLNRTMASYLMPATGFFLSIMFPTMFSVAIEDTKGGKGTASGILMSAVIGGAILPVIMGIVGDAYGLTSSFLILFVPLSYIFLRSITIRNS